MNLTKSYESWFTDDAIYHTEIPNVYYNLIMPNNHINDNDEVDLKDLLQKAERWLSEREFTNVIAQILINDDKLNNNHQMTINDITNVTWLFNLHDGITPGNLTYDHPTYYGVDDSNPNQPVVMNSTTMDDYEYFIQESDAYGLAPITKNYIPAIRLPEPIKGDTLEEQIAQSMVKKSLENKYTIKKADYLGDDAYKCHVIIDKLPLLMQSLIKNNIDLICDMVKNPNATNLIIHLNDTIEHKLEPNAQDVLWMRATDSLRKVVNNECDAILNDNPDENVIRFIKQLRILIHEKKAGQHL